MNTRLPTAHRKTGLATTRKQFIRKSYDLLASDFTAVHIGNVIFLDRGEYLSLCLADYLAGLGGVTIDGVGETLVRRLGSVERARFG